MEFALHPRLAADSLLIGDLPLCRLLLSNDGQYPWCILVPRRADIREIYQLSDDDQAQLLRESTALSRALMHQFDGEKLNVAALGNLVPQLHLHHIVRYASDPAWPSPVWGRHLAQPYAEAAAAQRIAVLRRALTAAGLSLR